MNEYSVITKYIVCLVFPIVTLTSSLYSQEELTGLFSNRALQEKSQTLEKRSSVLPLKLPFIDDFSTTTGYPNQNLWSDSTAYINKHMSLYGISIGVATLDGADSKGDLYPLGFGQTHRKGDSLTSQPINISEFQLSDSIYLSFFYQSGGLGPKPGLGDSLIVDFYDTSKWTKVWATDGNISDDKWRQVLIPIKKEVYLHEQFRFRFRNIVSPSGGGVIATNCDMWNIDYVRLDAGRHINDTVVKDVAFTRPPNSVLKQYSSMPWKHYALSSANERGNIDFYFANHDNINNQNITIYYKVSRIGSTYSDSSLIGAMNYQAFEQIEYSEPVTQNLFPLINTDSVDYLLETKLLTSASYPKYNNVASRLHHFSNYYAYDDGSAEDGYNLNQTGNMAAVKYETSQGDSLRGVYMYFNTTRDTSFNTNYFDLCVWANDGGTPGRLIYSKSGFTPSFNNQNRFAKLMFDSAIYVSGYFFVGWRKTTDRIMSVGIDKNTIVSQRNFYNLGQQWKSSAYNYAIMIRPILERKTTTGIESHQSKNELIYVYPIPTNSVLNISYPDHKRPWMVTVSDLSGRSIYQSKRPDSIDCSHLDNGIYIISFTEGREKQYQKIIIQK